MSKNRSFSKHNRLSPVLGAILLCLGGSGRAEGGLRPRVVVVEQAAGGKTVAVLTVNEKPAATLRVGAGGMSARARADLAAQRLQTLVKAGLGASDITAEAAAPPVWQVTARGGVLLSATARDAAMQHMPPEALARTWVKTLRALLQEPPLTLSVTHLVLPLGETRTVLIGGAASPADVNSQGQDPQIIQSHYDPAQRSIVVHGLSPGQSVVEIKADAGVDGQATVSLPVIVEKYAARISPTATVSVTGSPAAPPETVTQAIYVGLARAIAAEDGAQLTLPTPPKIDAALAEDAQRVISIPVRLTGDALLPAAGTVTVTVINQPQPTRYAKTLLYSNNPERVRHSGTLFTGQLQPWEAARLDYHHINASGAPLVFHTDLINRSSSQAAVQVIMGIALPGTDTVQVGRRAGAAFLKAWDSDVGLIVDVPPHARVSLVTQRTVDGLTVSGILQALQMGGPRGALLLCTSTDTDSDQPPSPLARTFLAAVGGNAVTPHAPAPWDDPASADDRISPYVFSSPQVSLAGSYTVGGRWAYVRIGQGEALKNTNGLTLWGNYGVNYSIALQIANPTTAARQVGVYFAPEAGAAAGVFQIDGGPILEWDPTQPPDERELTRYTLNPGETRAVRIQTIPLNGSAYPASLLVHSLDTPVPAMAPPAPVLPPTAALDGKGGGH